MEGCLSGRKQFLDLISSFEMMGIDWGSSHFLEGSGRQKASSDGFHNL
jgi:hypothetical protein